MKAEIFQHVVFIITEAYVFKIYVMVQKRDIFPRIGNFGGFADFIVSVKRSVGYSECGYSDKSQHRQYQFKRKHGKSDDIR